jgi:hypothetical protein
MAGFGDLEALDEYLDGQLSLAAGLLAEGKTARLFETFRDTVAGVAGLKHEQTNGLLTPAAIADQGRREAVGRQAAYHDAMARANAPQMDVTGGANPMPGSHSTGRASPGCMRGAHSFGTLRGPNGEGECRDCGTVFIVPPSQ